MDNFKICLREAKIFDGPHKNIKIVSTINFSLFSHQSKGPVIIYRLGGSVRIFGLRRSRFPLYN